MSDPALNPTPAPDERAYWLAKLDGFYDKVGFAPDREPDHEPATPLEFTLDPTASSQVMKLAGGSPAKVFMVLAALVAGLLQRYSGRRDLVIAAPIHRQPEAGRFINTVLPLRVGIGPQTSFKQLLVDLRQTILEAVDHQNYPLNRLYHDLGLPPQAAGSPLMDVALYLEEIHDPAYLDPAGVGLTFGFRLAGGDIAGRILADPARYGRATRERIAGHLVRLAGLALADLDRSLQDLDLIGDQVRREFFFNHPAPATSAATLPALFAAQAAATPEAIALRLDDQALTYADLNSRANRLAHHLLALGLTAEEIVAVATHTSFDFIASLLAVMKAGGAYLPLDPGLPPERLASMAADAGLRLAISTRPWPEAAALGLSVIDPGPPQHDRALPRDDPEPLAGLGSLAYVIFTSGSTGRPKGVLIEQRGLVNYALWRRDAQGLGHDAVVLQLVPEAFDGFGANLYPTLLAGATLVLINEERWGEVAHIRSVLAHRGVTHCAVVPSMYRLLLEGAAPEELASLRRVTLAGERAPAALLRTSTALSPQAQLDNEYGPTEDSVTSAAYFGMTPATVGIIGRPIAGHYTLVLDDDLHLKPIGEPGELCLAGVGLARGYLNRPEETATRFVANPHHDYCHGARRLYRTGDLARWLPDGNLELLGRLDQQVQVHGFRVEPQEIEARLLAHPRVRQAAVAARTDDQGQTALWAWLASEGELDPEDLRRHLLASLPEYMLPSVFLTAPALPLNRNGKLDRAGLESLEAVRLGAGAYQAPRDAREATLARIWADKLGLERVGVHDNYFNLGGDSVKAISLLAAINRELECALKIPDLYEHKTVAELARRIGQFQDVPQARPTQGAEDAVAALRQRILGR
ncbi:MAG: amino acid adenylation domain-containing protein [Desulfarculus sp.]|nr:amino acid adenylation domain-containing protein [Desulfarculus sp.]